MPSECFLIRLIIFSPDPFVVSNVLPEEHHLHVAEPRFYKTPVGLECQRTEMPLQQIETHQQHPAESVDPPLEPSPADSNNLNLGLLMRSVLMHDDFYSTQARTGLVRSPVEWAVACARGGASPTSESRPDWWISDMGQSLLHPPNPSGWNQNGEWISATGAWARADFASHLAYKMRERKHLTQLTDMSVPAAIDLLRVWFSLNNLTAHTRRALEDYLYAERANEEWPQFRNVLVLLMLSPEMQLA